MGERLKVAISLAVAALIAAPVANAEPVTIEVELTLVNFRWYRDFMSCHGGLKDKPEDAANYGYDPTIAIALRGASNGDISTGVAGDSEVVFGNGKKNDPTACKISALVTVSKPDTAYWVKWGSRDWEPQPMKPTPASGLYQEIAFTR